MTDIQREKALRFYRMWPNLVDGYLRDYEGEKPGHFHTTCPCCQQDWELKIGDNDVVPARDALEATRAALGMSTPV